MRRREFLGASLLPLVGCSSRSNWKAQIPGLESQLPKLMEEAKVPGLSVALIQDGELVYRRGFGVKDVASKVPVDNDTGFEAASMSKPVFAYSVMKLAEKGVLELDTPLTKYTPERFLEGDPRLDLITARHVLSHTSGFQNWRTKEEPLKIHSTPGKKWLYSGEGYNYLQTVVTRLTGQPFDTYMRKNIFIPFGMTSSGYVWNDWFEAHMARPHGLDGKPVNNKKSTTEDVARYGSAGALLSTPSDYAKFLIEVITPKPADAFRLNSASLAEMVRPQVKVDDKVSWALGWTITRSDKGTAVSHGGDNDGFHCQSVTSRKSGYVVMTNGENGLDLLQKSILQMLNQLL